MRFLLLAALFTVSAATVAEASSPWDGSWVLDPRRSTPGSETMAAPGYVFHLEAGRIRWEIPALGEVVTGPVDGTPMPVRRTRPTPGLTLSVRADPPANPAAPPTLLYEVRRNGTLLGSGRMTLVEDGRAWVDLSWPAGQPVKGGALVYVRR